MRTPTRLAALRRILPAILVGSLCESATAAIVRVMPSPNEGIQPQAIVDADDRIHIIYYKGDPAGGDLFYTVAQPGSTNFSQPIRVNQTSGTAIAAGSIRGAQLTLGRKNRVHVVWNGAREVAGRPYAGVPLYYTRLNDSGNAFEPERDLIHTAGLLDGGASVAANPAGEVSVFWHGVESTRTPSESNRTVFVTVSLDDGRTFPEEQPMAGLPRGVCACCGLRAFADAAGPVALFYRSARTPDDRDGQLLLAPNSNGPFKEVARFPWRASACPMSSATFAASGRQFFVAGESSNRVWFASLDTRSAKAGPAVFPDEDKPGKHPGIAVAPSGELLLAWAEGSGWARGGRLSWQLFDASGKPGRLGDSKPNLPTWSFPAVVARRDGSFLILY